MTETEFAKELLALAVTFNEDTEAQSWLVKREIYRRLFQTWPLVRFQAAVAAWIKTARFFPKPAELNELGRAWAQEQAAAALSAPSGRGELLAPAEVKALVKELSATLSRLGRCQTPSSTVSDTLPKSEPAPECEVYAGALIPRASNPAPRPCGCLYDTVAVGTAGEFKLLAQCADHCRAEHKALAAAARYAQRPLEKAEVGR